MAVVVVVIVVVVVALAGGLLLVSVAILTRTIEVDVQAGRLSGGRRASRLLLSACLVGLVGLVVIKRRLVRTEILLVVVVVVVVVTLTCPSQLARILVLVAHRGLFSSHVVVVVVVLAAVARLLASSIIAKVDKFLHGMSATCCRPEVCVELTALLLFGRRHFQVIVVDVDVRRQDLSLLLLSS